MIARIVIIPVSLRWARTLLVTLSVITITTSCHQRNSAALSDTDARKMLAELRTPDPSECDSTQAVCKMRQLRIWKECLRKGQFPPETCDQFLVDGYQICERNYPGRMAKEANVTAPRSPNGAVAR